MHLGSEAVFLHEGLAGRRAISPQARALLSGGVSRRPFADEAETPVDRDMALIAEVGMAMSTGGLVPSGRSFALLNFTVQRASRSFCRNFAGFFSQPSGMRPSLIAFFSSSVFAHMGFHLSSRQGCGIKRSPLGCAESKSKPDYMTRLVPRA